MKSYSLKIENKAFSRERGRDDESSPYIYFRGGPFLATISSRSSRVRETMRAKRVKQEVDVGVERRPPPEDTIKRGEEEARDPISVFARHYPRHCSSSRIRPESRSGRGSFVSLSPPFLPRPPEIPLSLSVIYGS